MGLTSMWLPWLPLISTIAFSGAEEAMFVSAAVVSRALKQSNVFFHHKVLWFNQALVLLNDSRKTYLRTGWKKSIIVQKKTPD